MRHNKRAGLSLIETALIISVVGTILAVVIPTFIRALRTSKVAEASIQLNALYRATSAYYSGRYREGRKLLSRCLPPQAGPAPAKPSDKPLKVDFYSGETPGAETWRALKFNPSEPLRFCYSFLPRISGCGLHKPPNTPLVILRAEGDLDGDNEYSTFERMVVVSEQNELALEKLLFVKDRTE
ncbi:MAG: type II secretion system protein [Deltaproteobacteria bacterium]|nr:type II secretion system protein [Deltaproteobacteria bacterium]